MKRTFVAFLCVIFLPLMALGQAGSTQADGFQGLILNQSTVKDAISIWGQPAKDKVGNLDVSKIGRWLDPKHKEKIFRQLTFKKVGDFRTVELSFLDDKLMMIELEFGKNIKPEKLRDIFGVEFAPVGGWSDLPDKPGQYPRPFSVTTYPQSFNVVGISNEVFIWANCTASPSGEPISINRTQQISRALEKK